LCREGTAIISPFGSTARREVAAYRPAQVAAWLNLPTATVRAWAKGQYYDAYGKRRFFRPVIEPTRVGVPRNGPLALSFVNFVELHVLSALRGVHAVSLPKIRRSIEYLAAHYPDVNHPLADLDLLTDGLDVWLEELGSLVAVSEHGQLGIKDVLEAHLRRVERGPHGEALRLYPFPHTGDVANQPRSIVVDPEVAFGRPTLVGTAIPTRVIAGRFDAGESLESLIEDFGRPQEDILEAIRWERRERRAA
jgi:uncharacterized protein (DUF433 family)